MRIKTIQDNYGDFKIVYKGYVISLALGGHDSLVFKVDSPTLFKAESTDGEAIKECITFIDSQVLL